MTSRTVVVVTALAVPCFVFAAMAFLSEVWLSDKPSNAISFASCLGGFLLLASAFRGRALLVAIVYFPLMIVLFFYVSVAVVGLWFGGP